MNAMFRHELKLAYDKDNLLCNDVERYDAFILQMRSEYELARSLARTCLLIGDSIEGLKTACALENSESIETMSSWIVRALCTEHGLHEYAAAWAVNCWLYVFQSSVFFKFTDHIEKLREYTTDKLAFLANHGDAYAAYYIFQEGRMVEGRTADEWLEIAANADLAIARCVWAEKLLSDGTDGDVRSTAIKIWKDATAMGCLEAAECLERYVEANQVEVTDATLSAEQQEYEHIEQLALAGDVDAQLKLGSIFDHGYMGCQPNLNLAFKWYLEAAKANNPEGLFNVAQCYRNGEGVDKDLETAFQYMKRSAEQGYVDAIEQLAGMYFAGEGINVSEPTAAEWFTKAANAGSGWACSMLASLYDVGLGVAQDSELAEQYRQRAFDLGYVEEDEGDSETHSIQSFDGDATTFLANKLIGAMSITWNALYNAIESRELYIYATQGREYMYILMRLAMEYCNERIDNLAQQLVEFVFSSACESFMEDITQEQFSIEYKHFVTMFDRIHESQEKKLADTLGACFYTINKHSGLYDPAMEKELTIEFVQIVQESFLPVISDIMGGEEEKNHQSQNIDSENYIENIGDENLRLLLEIVQISWSKMCDVMRIRGYEGNADLAQGYMFLLLWISETLPVYSVEETTKAVITMLVSEDWRFVMNGMDYEDFTDAYVDARERMNQFSKIPLGEAIKRELLYVNSRYYDQSQFTQDGSLEEQRDVVLQVFVKNLSALSIRSMSTKQ